MKIMKASTRKLLYPLILLSLLAGFILAYQAGIRPAYLLLFALVLSVASRLANYLLRDFYRGLQAFQQRDLPLAESSFQSFLSAVARRRWIKRLMWFNWGSYTGDVEAMTHNNLGAICLETRRLDEAKAHLQTALSLDADYAKPHYNLAVIGVLQSDEAASEHHLAEARRLGFTNSAYDQFLGKVQTEYADFNVEANRWLKPD